MVLTALSLFTVTPSIFCSGKGPKSPLILMVLTGLSMFTVTPLLLCKCAIVFIKRMYQTCFLEIAPFSSLEPHLLYDCTFLQEKECFSIENTWGVFTLKHCHTFWSITSLIFNGFSIRKKFWKAETQGFPTIAFTLFNVKSMESVYAKTLSHILLHKFLEIAPFTHFSMIAIFYRNKVFYPLY